MNEHERARAIGERLGEMDQEAGLLYLGQQQLALQGLAEALRDANVALERVSAHFWKIRPEHLEPSAMMNQVDSVLINNRAALESAKPFLEGKP